MVLEAIKSRRSTRRFLETNIPSDTLMLLIEAARWAPSGSNRQPWLFVIVQDPFNIGKIKMFSPGLHGIAPVLFVLCTDTSVEGSTHRMDISMAAQNILLVATENGIASCPVRSFNQRAVQLLLHLPQHVIPELIISLGYSATPNRTSVRRAVAEMVHWERYGGRPSE